jgi:4'-phosphopantetheinyl transferase
MADAALTELWLVELVKAAPALAEIEAETPRLSCDDRRRALRLADARERQLRLAAYCALRLALERFVGQRARRVAFLRDRAGAPYLAGIPARFNLSHSRGVALIAVTRLHAIGVDVEGVRTLPMADAGRQQLLAVAAGLSARPLSGSANRMLLQAWTRLEAFAKARGGGVRRLVADLRLAGPAHPNSSPRTLVAAAYAEAQKRALRVSDLDLGPTLVGAVALAASARPPRPRHFPCDAAGVRLLVASG